ncbi:hypothetical protein ACJMK2_011600 [Sinanodonta woodiana]|uniref:Retinol dehydrogenase 12 n=2 Tax=Sinanodonta woodiana TaxID=1069815 RepID=A0ABD3V5J5_SINWO
MGHGDFTHSKHKGREKPTIWQADQDVDIEDLTFVIPIVISVVLLSVFLLRKYIRWTVQCPSNNRLDGKTVVITGANTGLGKATAMELAKRGAKVILACRDRKKGDAVARQIRIKTTNEEIYSYHLDLSSLVAIKEFVNDFTSREPFLHILINNAAYMGPKATTEDGYERTFGVNYLGHFYLTYLLQDRLKRCASSRVINVISDSYTKATLDFEDLAMTKYDIYKAYARSKLALIFFTGEAARRWMSSHVLLYGVHPGMVCTDLLRNWPGLMGNILRTTGRILFKSPEDGCQTIVYCAVANEIKAQTGKYLENCQLIKVKKAALDKDMAQKLWELSLHLCKLPAEPKTDIEVKSIGKPEVAADGKDEDRKLK